MGGHNRACKKKKPDEQPSTRYRACSGGGEVRRVDGGEPGVQEVAIRRAEGGCRACGGWCLPGVMVGDCRAWMKVAAERVGRWWLPRVMVGDRAAGSVSWRCARRAGRWKPGVLVGAEAERARQWKKTMDGR
ncbi:hypothetical protein Dimus_027244 [Dionaea muscipula]